MQFSKFNVVTDGQWGSCGKGLIATAVADKFKPEVISTTNMANAGHTAVNEDGREFIAKAIPSGAALNLWRDDYDPFIIVGSSAAFHLDKLLEEIHHCDVQDRFIVHDRAGVITSEHQNAENDLQKGTKHIASTMQGCGAFLSDKVMRRKSLKLARDYEQLKPYLASRFSQINQKTPIKFQNPEMGGLENSQSQDIFPSPQEGNNNRQALPLILKDLLLNGGSIIHEGSQGFSLDINHGSHYPQCTSRGTTAVQNLADMGLAANDMGDVYLVIRPYPIRVGNVIENDQMVGYSGDAYPGQNELEWSDVASMAGAPPEVMAGELTTVTKRLRRVFEFSEQQLLEAVVSNGATRIALNFANYIDWSCYGVGNWDELPAKVIDFINKIEDIAQVPVTVVGTGPQNNHVCFR
ncbi:adenylosuccinate synthetase [bacterium]|nr:adenylosuccinate synthetase [bacterium]